MQQLSPHVSTIALEFEKKIKDLNDTFRSHFDALLNNKQEDEGDVDMPEAVKGQIQNHLHNLYLYTIANYNKFPKDERIEIKYYDPFSGTDQDILISTALRYVYAFYLKLDVVNDPAELKFGNYVIDNYLIVVG